VDDADRYRLLGKYRTPRVRVGRIVRCEIRGEVEVASFTDAPIPWPKCRTARRHAIILYGDLARTVRQESEQAVAHWWGIDIQTVWKWRKALDVGATTSGTSRLRSDYTKEPWAVEALAAAQAKADDPERREKIAAAKRGKARPPHVIEAMREGRTGTPQSDEARQKMSEAHKARGTRPPKAGRPGEPEEVALLGTMPDAEVASRAQLLDLRFRIQGEVGSKDGQPGETWPILCYMIPLGWCVHEKRSVSLRGRDTHVPTDLA
jgi:hypothetical protein